MNVAIRGHLFVEYAMSVISQKNKMMQDPSLRMQKMVANGKVDNVLKPTKTKRLGNVIINDCRHSTAKFFKDIVEYRW